MVKLLFKERIELFFKSIKINYIFWIVITLSVLSIQTASKTNTIFESYFSLVYAMICSYWFHYLCHSYDFESILVSDDSYSITKIFAKFLDFHDKIHHNSEINKTPINILIELADNIGMTSLCGIFNSFTILGKTINISKPVLILWGLLYTTAHHINYNILEVSEMHKEHHKNKYTNYGLDSFDILFDSKYSNKIENYNNASINIIILTIIILNFYAYWERK